MQEAPSEVMIGAFHEAGHVVMHDHRGMSVSGFMVTHEGTGEMIGRGHPRLDTASIVDSLLAGPAAEGMFRGQDQCPGRSRIEDALEVIGLGDDVDDPDDYHKAVECVVRANPTWSVEQITRFLQHAFVRCKQVLEERWDRVELLASLAAVSPGEYVTFDQIEAILTPDP